MSYNVIRAAIPETLTISTWSINGTPPAEDAFYLYVCGRDHLIKIDKTSGIMTNIMKLSYPGGLYFSCNPVYYSSKLYCLCNSPTGTHALLRIDPSTLTVEASYSYTNLSYTEDWVNIGVVDTSLYVIGSFYTYVFSLGSMAMTARYFTNPYPPNGYKAIIYDGKRYTFTGTRIYVSDPLTGQSISCKEILLDGSKLTGSVGTFELIDDNFYIGYAKQDGTYNFGVMSIPADLSNVSASIRMVADKSTKSLYYPSMSTRKVSCAVFSNGHGLYLWSHSSLIALPYTSNDSMLCEVSPDTSAGFPNPTYAVQWTGMQSNIPSFFYYGTTNIGIGGKWTYLYNESSSAHLYTLNTINEAYTGFSDSPLALEQRGAVASDEFSFIRDDVLSLSDVEWSNVPESYPVGTQTEISVSTVSASYTLYSENINRFGIDTISGIGYTTDGVLRAAMTGKVYGDGTPADCSFEWGKTDSYGHETITQSISGSASGVSYGYGISNNTLPSDEQLKPATLYHFRAKGVHPTEGTFYGEDATFYMPGAILPTATISRVGSIKHVYDRTQAGIPPKFYMEVNLGGLAPEYMEAFNLQPVTYNVLNPPAWGIKNGGRPDPVYPSDDTTSDTGSGSSDTSYNDYPPGYDPPWPNTDRPKNGGRPDPPWPDT